MREGEPSSTAVGVALARSTMTRPSSAHGDPAADEALAASLVGDGAGGLSERAADAAETVGDRALDFLTFLTARTEFFDAVVLEAVGGRAPIVDQVVVLGAGYDGRSLRFRTPGVRFFEVDHPATQADKRRRLVELGIDTTGITFVAADFTEPGMDEAMAAAGHRTDRPSLVLLEGVLRYLPEEWFRELLASIARWSAPGGELAASVSPRPPAEEDPDEAEARLAHERHLADRGEPVLTVPAREVALRWLGEAGWDVTSVVDIAELRPGSPEGRLLVRARPR